MTVVLFYAERIIVFGERTFYQASFIIGDLRLSGVGKN